MEKVKIKALISHRDLRVLATNPWKVVVVNMNSVSHFINVAVILEIAH